MGERKDGGAAFPFGVQVKHLDTYGGGEPYIAETNEEGMSLRDYFAAKALQAIISTHQPSAPEKLSDSNRAETLDQYECFSVTAYLIADAMLKERAK